MPSSAFRRRVCREAHRAHTTSAGSGLSGSAPSGTCRSRVPGGAGYGFPYQAREETPPGGIWVSG